MRLAFWPVLALIGLAAAGCNSSSNDSGTTTASGGTTTGSTAKNSSGDKALVAFSQANSADPWRQVFDAATKAEAEKHPELTLQEQSAEDDANKQINQIDTLMLQHPKVLLVSPATEAVTTATDKAFDAGIPVVTLDRNVTDDKYTVYVGGDNKEIGRQAGEYIAKQLNGKGTVLMIQGIADATPTHDRRDGAMESFKKYPGITVISGDDCGYQRQKAQSYMETFLQGGKPFDAVYAHNDEMAIGAYNAWDQWNSGHGGKNKKPLFVGVDGCQKEVVDMIQAGKIDATFKYPVPGPKGVEVAADILKGNMPKDKKIVLPTEIVTKDTAAKYLAANPSLAK
ncbi:substrate-binding domain-containing protein [Fimbriimonas ginsengisoli]|uniref:Periplasmic ribose-binding protein n=1 Tax=Fimbriimonas ginsengisoli Gsoil 348 TaxID=661478 RepID=A0A068NQ13_FIMGI|nr:substrate-binding domain-containing protein [Fimbriimonas ginsengisoli]AIE85633.1 periplasmic ribose-binding protein [Fimbriimonas ginsengisoli Gsoil 348]